MTTTTQPVPVGQAAAKQGPNKALLVILGILVAVALFVLVIKPMFLDSKPSAPPQQPAATTQAPSKSGSGATATTAAPGTGSGSATAPSEATGDAEAGATTTPQADALPQIPAQYAGQQARDPFVPLVKDAAASSTSAK